MKSVDVIYLICDPMGQPLIILMEKQYAEENAPFAVEGGCVFIIFPT